MFSSYIMKLLNEYLDMVGLASFTDLLKNVYFPTTPKAVKPTPLSVHICPQPRRKGGGGSGSGRPVVMMSLKPRNVDFQETWASLKETVAGVVALKAVERAVWNTRFSDVYALCVAHPEPLAEKLYNETKIFLEEHVAGLLERVRGNTPLEHNDHNDGLLTRYVAAWQEYSQGVAYLNSLYSYLNLQHVKRQKVCDAEIIYGSAAAVSSEQDCRQLEVGEIGLVIWERVLIRPLSSALSSRIVSAISACRQREQLAPSQAIVQTAIYSYVHVQSFRVRNPLTLYQQLVLNPYLEAASGHHAAFAASLLENGDISHYMKHVLEGLEREIALGARLLHSSSTEAVRECYEKAAVAAHLPTLHSHCERLLKEASEDGPNVVERRADLRRLYTLLKPLTAQNALRPLVEAAHLHIATQGHALLADLHNREDAHIHFVNAMLDLHGKYTALFNDVFSGAQPFVGALDKACSQVVNSRGSAAAPTRAPELLARYCDCLLRKKGADCTDPDTPLQGAIVVFKYVDDKDVFQKYYARALARRLIHQLSASMEQEEAMINRLKAACGYEFTNKLHRMFTDVAVSADLNAKFQRHLRDTGERDTAGFTVQVLQAGAWPLGGAMAPMAPPLQLERPARLFEAFYRNMFSGRRLAWLHHLCTGELRTRYTGSRVYHVTATTPQCALLLCFESQDVGSAKELRETLQLNSDCWTRHMRPLVDAGLLIADGDVESEDCEGTLTLNLNFTCKRTKVRVTAANAPNQPGGAGNGSSQAEPEVTHCDDDRKMYLQAALVRIMKQRKVLRHTDLIQEVVAQASGSFASSVGMIKKCIEALIDKQYLERAPGAIDTYSYLA